MVDILLFYICDACELQYSSSCDIIKSNIVSILRGIMMSISHDKLWDILRERGLSRTELVHMAKISTNAMAKLGKNEDVRMQILIKICLVLNCKIDDIMEYGVDLK